MDEEKKEVLYQLKSTFEYAFKGENRTASFISLRPPTMREHHPASQLKQSIMTMIRTTYSGDEILKAGDQAKSSNQGDTTADDDITAELILTLLFSSDNLDINVVFEQAKVLFKAGVALIDGEQVLNNPLVDKMSIDDFQNIVGEYIANFILA